MVLVCSCVAAFESPKSPLLEMIPRAGARTALLACIVGISATFLIHSPWGKRSGAHMNPAITLSFLRLRKIRPFDALFYILAQIIGGTIGVIVAALLWGDLFTSPPVHYAVTRIGSTGEVMGFVAEAIISFVLMAIILFFTTSIRLIRYTGVAVGIALACFIVIDAPISGASMNPARSLASAIPAMTWEHIWIYLLAPTVGMLVAAELHRFKHGDEIVGCAKLLHPENVPCIHCEKAGYQSTLPHGK